MKILNAAFGQVLDGLRNDASLGQLPRADGGVLAAEQHGRRIKQKHAESRCMKPVQGIQWLAVLMAILGFGGLYFSLLIDVWDADALVKPRDIQITITPILSGALGLLLALALGVEPQALSSQGFSGNLKALISKLLEVELLLKVGACVYLLAGLAGGVVWWHNGDAMPDTAKAIALTVFGYVAATVTARARA